MTAGDLAMPLRNHFRPPLDDSRSWDELHGAWPTVIVMSLNRKLPPRYVAAPRVEQDEYEVRVYDTQRHRRLVAAVEIVSPANKDRPEHRRAFVTKCAAMRRTSARGLTPLRSVSRANFAALARR
jgi:hypothetical protein